jgi:peptidyl-tRNA hydrolase, PTH2 family
VTEDGGVKQVIIIRKDLKMRRGKEIAQGAHASMAWLTNRLRQDGRWAFPARLSAAECEWIKGSFRKITCAVDSEGELLAVVQQARDAGLVTELIRDAGLTEFGGVPTFTAAAIGPDYDRMLDPVTGHLRLY